MTIDIQSLAVRILRLSAKDFHLQLDQVKKALENCSIQARKDLSMSNDVEIYRLLEGDYPHAEFYKHLMSVTVRTEFTEWEQAIHHRAPELDEQLSRILLHMDDECVLVNDVPFLRALETIMLPVVRECVSRLDSDMLALVIRKESLEKGQVSGMIQGLHVIATIPPELENFLELVSLHIEIRS